MIKVWVEFEAKKKKSLRWELDTEEKRNAYHKVLTSQR